MIEKVCYKSDIARVSDQDYFTRESWQKCQTLPVLHTRESYQDCLARVVGGFMGGHSIGLVGLHDAVTMRGDLRCMLPSRI